MMVVLTLLLTLFGSPNGPLRTPPPVAYDGMSGFPGVAPTAPVTVKMDDGMSGFPGH
jgi:hypothetical protein